MVLINIIFYNKNCTQWLSRETYIDLSLDALCAATSCMRIKQKFINP